MNESEGVEKVISARLDNVRLLADALSCIHSTAHKSQDVTLSVPAAGGLKFTLSQHATLLASVLLPISSFAHFSCADASVRIRLNLSLLLDCLNIFSASSSTFSTSSATSPAVPVTILYSGLGHALVLQFTDADAITVCKLLTIEDDNHAAPEDDDFNFMRSGPPPNMALLHADTLRDALAELDYGGALTADLRMAPTRPRFLFESPARAYRGGGGSDSDDDVGDGPGADARCAVELPDPEDRSLAVFTEFRSDFAQVSAYKLELLRRCGRALSLSETCKVQMSRDGMLSVVCRMRPGLSSSSAAAFDRRPGATSGGDHCFTEFLIVADEVGDGMESASASGDER